MRLNKAALEITIHEFKLLFMISTNLKSFQSQLDSFVILLRKKKGSRKFAVTISSRLIKKITV